MRRHLRKILLAVLVIVVLAVIVFLSRNRIHLADFSWARFKQGVREANPWLLMISVIAIYGCYAIRAVRWQQFSRSLGPTRFLGTYSATIQGFASIFILGRPGEAVRPLLLAKKGRFPVASMFGIWVTERIFDFAAAVGLAMVSLLVFARQLSDAGLDTSRIASARTGGVVLLCILLALIVLMVYFHLHGAGALERRLESWHQAGGWRGWVATFVAGFAGGVKAVRKWSDLWLAAAYTVAHWALVALAFLWIPQAFPGAFPHSQMNYPGAMLLLAVTLVGSVLQLPGVGGGTQIASFLALTTIFGVDPGPAAVIAVMLWLITFAAPTVVGIPLLIHEGLSFGELRQLARAEVQAEEAGEHVSMAGVGPHKPGIHENGRS